MIRRYFSLLEVLIALSLTLLILSSLLAAYLSVERSNAYWDSQEKQLFRERFFSHRLTEVFNHLKRIDQTKTFFFTGESSSWQMPGTSSLIFTYDNGASLDTSLSGRVLARLFVDPQGQLTIITWPDRENWPESGMVSFHREVLMLDVIGLQLSFFKLIADEEASSEIGWTDRSYSKDNKSLPGAIKMEIKTKDEKIHSFYFPIPVSLAKVIE